MKVALVVAVLVAAVGCSEVDPARHLDGGMADAPPPGSVELSVAKTGTGSGTITSSPAGISCGESCTAGFTQGSKITLIAEAAADSNFAGWSGACSGTTAACEVTLDAAANVTATFTLKTYTVTVAKAGAGTGSISGGGTTCTSSCTLTVDHGTTLSFTATPTNLSVFAGWGGACTNSTGPCEVMVTSDINISASFALDNFSLIVVPSGNGSGTVTSNPAGISCGSTCTRTYTANQTVTLTAAATTSSNFTGWSGGGCSGTGTCTVTIDGAKTVTATFTLKTFALNVTKVGFGTVTSNPSGITCGGTCSATYNYGQSVTLSATPLPGYAFTGFSGSCTGMTCTVNMTATRNVTAAFAPLYTLTVSQGGDGAGTVTGGSINCGSTCTQTSVSGTTVTLSAAPSSASSTLSTFTGWSGACTGTGTCTVTLDADVAVTANFKLKPNIMFVTSKRYSGAMGGVNGIDAECKALASAAGLPGSYRGYVTYKTGATTSMLAPQRFTGASGWVRVDGKPVMEAIDQMHKGTLVNPPRLDENGNDVTQSGFEFTWTGIDRLANPKPDCSTQGGVDSWTVGSNTMGIIGQAGFATATDYHVVEQDVGNCAIQAHLYCLGIDRPATVQ